MSTVHNLWLENYSKTHPFNEAEYKAKHDAEVAKAHKRRAKAEKLAKRRAAKAKEAAKNE